MLSYNIKSFVIDETLIPFVFENITLPMFHSMSILLVIPLTVVTLHSSVSDLPTISIFGAVTVTLVEFGTKGYNCIIKIW